MNVLKNTNKKIKTAFHVSDIHIRLTKRHDEYNNIFKNFYTALKKSDKKSSILVIAGDLFHNKSDLSPECVQIAGDFLKNCSDILPTILIAGNHDATLTNKNRLDSISPIINTLKHKNLYYLKDSGLYRYEDILFNNFSVFDNPSEDYISYDSIKSTYKLETNTHIALYHGPVNNAVTDIGYIINNNIVNNNTFKGHHISMLGDIHKHQLIPNDDEIVSKEKFDKLDPKEWDLIEELDDEVKIRNKFPVTVYSSSMIQQNHGETQKGHGYLKWDLEKRTFKFNELKNECGFYTIEIHRGKLVTDLKDIPSKVRLRVKCLESIPSQVKNVINDIRNKTDILETTYLRMDSNSTDELFTSQSDYDLVNISNVDYQNKLIETELSKNKIDKKIIDNVKKINEEINKEISSKEIKKNIRWKPKRFDFDNMFSYGEGNSIDFTTLSGTVGLFASNASGKSSIFEALSFCIFDKFTRGYKAIHILNSQKSKFKCLFNFEINGDDYFIERNGVLDKKGNVKVNVDFWKEINGEKIVLNGEARRSTNDIIRDYLGTYEDFLITVLSSQGGKNKSFIDLNQSERKELLSQFIGLNLFDDLSAIANDRFKDTNSLLKNFSKEEVFEELEYISGSIKNKNINIQSVKKEIQDLENEKENLSFKIIELSKDVKSEDLDIQDISILESNKNKYIKNIECILNDINEICSKISSTKNKIDDFKLEGDFDLIEKKYYEKEKLSKLEEEKSFELKNLKIIILNKLEKVKNLREHEYDPECEFCISNEFVKDAIKSEEEVKKDRIVYENKMNELNSLKESLKEYDGVDEEYKLYKTRSNQINDFKSNLSKLENNRLLKESQKMKLESNLTDVENQIKLFYDNKEIILKNKKLINEIEDSKSNLKSISSQISKKNDYIFNENSELGKHASQYETYEMKIKEIIKLEESYQAYKLYVDLVGKNGIPYNIISNVLPTLEVEINNILNQIVEFSVRLKTDGKNIISDIEYDDRTWPLEMSSGLERFVSGLAIRVALISISNLPRPNILAIDEGFGCADSDNLSQMGSLFSYLKHTFDFIWVISHLDQMKDMVDSRLEIKKEGKFSKINH